MHYNLLFNVFSHYQIRITALVLKSIGSSSFFMFDIFLPLISGSCHIEGSGPQSYARDPSMFLDLACSIYF